MECKRLLLERGIKCGGRKEGWMGEASKRAEREKMISAAADGGAEMEPRQNLPRMGF
jgi:hypothetical protein